MDNPAGIEPAYLAIRQRMYWLTKTFHNQPKTFSVSPLIAALPLSYGLYIYYNIIKQIFHVIFHKKPVVSVHPDCRVLSIRHIAILVKPQFECGPTALNKHGVLKNSKLALQIVEDVKSFLFQYYGSVEAMPSILEGRSGNQEYMVYAKDLRIS